MDLVQYLSKLALSIHYHTPSKINSHVMSPPAASNSAALNHGTQRSHSTSSGSPIQTNSPGLGSEPLADQLKPCPYSPLQNGMNGVNSPTSCAQPAPLVTIPTTHPQAMLPGPMYSPQEYGSNLNMNAAGTACLSSLPVWK